MPTLASQSTVSRRPRRTRFTIDTPPGFSFDATVFSHGWYNLAPFRLYVIK